MRRGLLAFVLASALACGGGELEPTNPQVVSIVGTWSATTLNGLALPAPGAVSPEIPSATITASVLTISDGHTRWSRTVTYAVDGASQTRTDGGTMIRDGHGFVLSVGQYGGPGGLIRDANTLDVLDLPNQWVYTR